MIDAAASIRTKLNSDLLAAMKSRDPVATKVLRSLLSALDNASAVPESAAHVRTFGHSGDVSRKNLSADECTAIFMNEAQGLVSAAAQYEGLGRHEEAARLRAELAVVERYVRVTE